MSRQATNEEAMPIPYTKVQSSSIAASQQQMIKIGQGQHVYTYISRTANGFYQCGLCGKESRDGSNMRRHMMIRHSEPTNEECGNCHRIFPNRFYLSRHLKGCSQEVL